MFPIKSGMIDYEKSNLNAYYLYNKERLEICKIDYCTFVYLVKRKKPEKIRGYFPFSYKNSNLMTFYTFLSEDDISYNKIAKQSSTYTGPTYGAGNAVDGNIATCMRTLDFGRNSPQKTVWWNVDLGGIYSIYSINILFRAYIGFGIYFVKVL